MLTPTHLYAPFEISPYICMSSSKNNPSKGTEPEQNIIYDFIKNQFQVNWQSLPASSITSRDVEAKHTRNRAEQHGMGASSILLFVVYMYMLTMWNHMCLLWYKLLLWTKHGINHMSKIGARWTGSQILLVLSKKIEQIDKKYLKKSIVSEN